MLEGGSDRRAARNMGRNSKKSAWGNTCAFMSACDGDKLEAFCVRPLTCVCVWMELLVGAGAGMEHLLVSIVLVTSRL